MQVGPAFQEDVLDARADASVCDHFSCGHDGITTLVVVDIDVVGGRLLVLHMFGFFLPFLFFTREKGNDDVYTYKMAERA